jgi:hypothetical protein
VWSAGRIDLIVGAIRLGVPAQVWSAGISSNAAPGSNPASPRRCGVLGVASQARASAGELPASPRRCGVLAPCLGDPPGRTRRPHAGVECWNRVGQCNSIVPASPRGCGVLVPPPIVYDIDQGVPTQVWSAGQTRSESPRGCGVLVWPVPQRCQSSRRPHAGVECWQYPRRVASAAFGVPTQVWSAGAGAVLARRGERSAASLRRCGVLAEPLQRGAREQTSHAGVGCWSTVGDMRMSGYVGAERWIVNDP